MQDIDVLVIGAGVIGLAIAREVGGIFKDVVVIEKNAQFGLETSSRNSEVVHGGMYYPGRTLKAGLCVEGRQLLYDLCQKCNIPYKKTGKLIVATEARDIEYLHKLFEQGRENGVNGLRLIEKSELSSIEKNVSALAALFSPETGIIDSHALMKHFFDTARDKGVIIAFNCEAAAIKKDDQGYAVSIKNGNDAYMIRSRIVVNCAGLNSDLIAAMAGIDTEESGYNLKFNKGEYFRINNHPDPVKRLVYPAPKPEGAGLGIHLTIDLNGGMRLGPDDEYLSSRDLSYMPTPSKRNEFFLSASRF